MLCREASQDQQLQSPQQYGIWHVEGLGLVVAFKGTSSWDDVFVDINVRPTPLTCEGGNKQLHVCHVTFEICERHCQENSHRDLCSGSPGQGIWYSNEKST